MSDQKRLNALRRAQQNLSKTRAELISVGYVTGDAVLNKIGTALVAIAVDLTAKDPEEAKQETSHAN